jgi:hypothetical protein
MSIGAVAQNAPPTAIKIGFLFYQRLETYLKNADAEDPLTAPEAFAQPDIKEVCRGIYQVRKACDYFVTIGLARKVQTKKLGYERGVGYYWNPDRIKENVPEPNNSVGKLSPKRKKHGKAGLPYTPIPKPEPAPETVMNEPITAVRRIHRTRSPEVETIIDSDVQHEKRVNLDFAGLLFTGPEGSKVNVQTDDEGTIVVTFKVKQ